MRRKYTMICSNLYYTGVRNVGRSVLCCLAWLGRKLGNLSGESQGQAAFIDTYRYHLGSETIGTFINIHY